SPLAGATLTLTGSQAVVAESDSQGKFRFWKLPTSGSYSLSVAKSGYNFRKITQTFVRPSDDLNVNFQGRLDRHTITGRIKKTDVTGISGISITSLELPATSATIDANGNYVLPEVAAGGNYTMVPLS